MKKNQICLIVSFAIALLHATPLNTINNDNTYIDKKGRKVIDNRSWFTRNFCCCCYISKPVPQPTITQTSGPPSKENLEYFRQTAAYEKERDKNHEK